MHEYNIPLDDTQEGEGGMYIFNGLHAWVLVWASHTQPISFNTPPCEVKTICSFCFSLIKYDKSLCLDQQW